MHCVFDGLRTRPSSLERLTMISESEFSPATKELLFDVSSAYDDDVSSIFPTHFELEHVYLTEANPAWGKRVPDSHYNLTVYTS